MEAILITVSRTRPSRHTGCQRCRIIRLFIMVVAMRVLIGLIAGDKFQFLNFLTAEYIAAAIWIVGGLGFLVKLLFWWIQKRRAVNDPEQA